MKIENLEAARDLLKELLELQDRRALWARVDLTQAYLPRAISDYQGSFNLPRLDCDPEMHSMLVQHIVIEYDRRIDAKKKQLMDLGIEIEEVVP